MLTHSIDSILAPSKPGSEVDTTEEKAPPVGVAECADTSRKSSSERKRKNSFDCEECGTPSPVSTPRLSDNSLNSSSDTLPCQPPRRKKSRTTFSPRQLTGLENHFRLQKYLSNYNRADLAKQLDLNEHQIKTWFQNRRMKDKRYPLDVQDPGHYGYQSHLVYPQPHTNHLDVATPLYPHSAVTTRSLMASSFMHSLPKTSMAPLYGPPVTPNAPPIVHSPQLEPSYSPLHLPLHAPLHPPLLPSMPPLLPAPEHTSFQMPRRSAFSPPAPRRSACSSPATEFTFTLKPESSTATLPDKMDCPPQGEFTKLLATY